MQRSVPSLLPGGTRDQRNGEPARPGPRLALMTGGLNFVAQPDQKFRRQVLVADDEIDPALVAKSARTHRARMARRNDPAIYGLGSRLVGQVRAVAQPLKRSAQLVSAQVSEAADVRPAGRDLRPGTRRTKRRAPPLPSWADQTIVERAGSAVTVSAPPARSGFQADGLATREFAARRPPPRVLEPGQKARRRRR